MEVYPSLAFDSLFDNRGSRRNQSILDRVQEQAAGLSRQVSAGDQAKLDEYLTSVREVEKRVEPHAGRQGQGRRRRASDRGRPAVTMQRPDNGLPEDIREHMRLMCDIVALAFQTDKTRVATLLLCRDISGLFYPFLDVRDGPPPGLARRPVRRLRAGLALLRQPARLPRRPARRDARRRRHGARQLLPAVPLEHVVRQQARQHASCRCCSVGGLGGTLETGRVLDYRDTRRRQPQAVQPVPLAHGPHGRQARPLRRRDERLAGL